MQHDGIARLEFGNRVVKCPQIRNTDTVDTLNQIAFAESFLAERIPDVSDKARGVYLFNDEAFLHAELIFLNKYRRKLAKRQPKWFRITLDAIDR